ncbi:type II secretion system protein [Alicyclobacillus sp.]|uniref:type IV pilus modification PilV family protein n=1 Tax=Alicyclobacillus sp. TaxID=61169 RepID=UPI0025BC219A|nr:type II secretion system protein [Alicyclobacillus sp.]MCL6516150.1 type II secretion system GspH family protein [Alicyclobacillus sp.]
MRRRETGSTLVTVLAAITILSVMLTALLAASAQEMTASKRSMDSAQALADARSALLAAYDELVADWDVVEALFPDGFQRPSDAWGAVQFLQWWAVNMSFPSMFRGQPVQVSLQVLEDAANGNLASGAQAPSGTSGYWYQNFILQATATRGSVTETLQTVLTLSNALPADGCAVMADQNVFFLGAPEVQGRLAAGRALYLHPSAWAAVSTSAGSGSYVSDLGQPLLMAAEPPGGEPAALPQWDAGTIWSAPAIYAVTRFASQLTPQSPTLFRTDGTGWYNPQAVSAGGLASFVTGSHLAAQSTVTSPAGAVGQVIQTYASAIQSAAQAVNKKGYTVQQGDPLPPGGGVVTYKPPKGLGGAYAVSGSTTVNGPLYFQGDLTIPPGAVLHLTGPLYVTGNLTVQGVLDTTAAIYVQGWTTVDPPAAGVGATADHPWVLYTGGDLTVSPAPGISGRTASRPVTLYAMLHAGGDVFLNGTTGDYRVLGSVSGQSVVLDGVVGQSQTASSGVVQTTDASDLSRRLVVVFHPAALEHPPAWSPGYADAIGGSANLLAGLAFQPMPQPVRVP